MRIMINGEERQVAQIFLDQILLECGFEQPFLATAVNSQFIHKEQRNQIQIHEDDRIEVLSPIEGG